MTNLASFNGRSLNDARSYSVDPQFTYILLQFTYILLQWLGVAKVPGGDPIHSVRNLRHTVRERVFMRNKLATMLLILLGIALFPVPGRGQSEAVNFTRKGDTIQVTIGNQPFTVYHFDPQTAKAYLQPLRDASGVVVTRGFPIGDMIPAAHQHDPSVEPHQRAMYFGHGNINGYDFWAEEV